MAARVRSVSRAGSAAIGAVANPALNVAETGGIHLLLQHADYGKIAEQHQPFDPVNLAVAAVAGVSFGAAFHRAKPKAPPALTPDEHAAALTMNEVHARDGDTLTQPGDLAASNAAREAQGDWSLAGGAFRAARLERATTRPERQPDDDEEPHPSPSPDSAAAAHAVPRAYPGRDHHATAAARGRYPAQP